MDADEHLAALRRAWETIRRRDLDGHLELYDPEVEIRPAFAVGGEAGWLRGLDGVRQAIENVAILRLDARGRSSGVELSGQLAQVSSVRDGRIIRLMNFLAVADAFEEMGRLLRAEAGELGRS